LVAIPTNRKEKPRNRLNSVLAGEHHHHRHYDYHDHHAGRALRGRSAPTAKKMPLTRPGPSTGANSMVYYGQYCRSAPLCARAAL
jgi:hypothetical protein